MNPTDLTVCTWLNGAVRQRISTSEMILPVEQLISRISAVMTLEAGDVILADTPAGAGEPRPGERVVAEIEGIGTLTHTVVSGEGLSSGHRLVVYYAAERDGGAESHQH